MTSSADTAATAAASVARVVLHFIEPLNSAFTVLQNCVFHPGLCGRINCVEIVAPLGSRHGHGAENAGETKLSSTSHCVQEL